MEPILVKCTNFCTRQLLGRAPRFTPCFFLYSLDCAQAKFFCGAQVFLCKEPGFSASFLRSWLGCAQSKVFFFTYAIQTASLASFFCICILVHPNVGKKTCLLQPNKTQEKLNKTIQKMLARTRKNISKNFVRVN